ncbi:MAG: hypothetical protein ABIJ09_17765 [Pseudomonadota bacterium]
MSIRIQGAGISAQQGVADAFGGDLAQQFGELEGLDVVDGGAAASFVGWAQQQSDPDAIRAQLQTRLDDGLRCGAEALQHFADFGVDIDTLRPAVPVVDSTTAGLLNEPAPLDTAGGLMATPEQLPNGANMLRFLGAINAREKPPIVPRQLDLDGYGAGISPAEAQQLDQTYGPGAGDFARSLEQNIIRFRAALMAALLGAGPEDLCRMLGLDLNNPEHQEIAQAILELAQALQSMDPQRLQQAVGTVENQLSARSGQGAPAVQQRTANKVMRDRYGIPAGGGEATRSNGPGLVNDEFGRVGQTVPPQGYPADLVQMCNEANKSVKKGANPLRPDMPPDLIRAAYRAHQLGLRITSTDEGRAGDGVHTRSSNHYKGRAIDVAGPASAMAQFTREQQARSPRELFFDPVGGWKRGQSIGAIGGHRDHVHIAF